MREIHHEGRKGEHHAGRQVDLAADHQHDFAERDDGGGCDELRQVLETRPGQQKVPVGGFEVADQDQRHQQDAGFAPTQECPQHERLIP
jgi:hypothetical protein